MTIHSMTGFSTRTSGDSWGQITWEIKSVNHRFLETIIRMPENLRHSETIWRQCIQHKIRRGKLEATLKYHPGNISPTQLALNPTSVANISSLMKGLLDHFPSVGVNLTELLNWEGMLSTVENKTLINTIAKAATELLQTTLDALIAARQQEGASIAAFLHKTLANLRNSLRVIESRIPQAQSLYRDKILSKFAQLQLNLDPDRLAQEMVWLVQKSDIAEEVQRLSAHLDEIERIINTSSVVGRRLDFLIQELNRETNTIASKSIDTQVSQFAVTMKVSIEQMREQVQNIE